RRGAAAALVLDEPADVPTAVLDSGWKVGPVYADFSATLKLTSGGSGLMLVELRVPSRLTLADVAVPEVHPPEVHHWSRHEDRVQVWLRQPRKDVTLRITGWA